MNLRAGIIAAGDGTRLRDSHPRLIKPMVPVAGVPLCHWVAAALKSAGVTELTVLLNSRGGAARQSLKAAFPDMKWTFLMKDTASSWESFRLVAQTLAQGGPDFLLSTVDCLIPPDEARRFADEARRSAAPAVLALTAFVDDENPLWADLDASSAVTALGDAARQKTHVTAGMYYLASVTAAVMPAAQAHGSLRSYLAALVRQGGVAGIPLSKTLDVDRPEDVRQAEDFVTWSPA